jgi:hypothetical protein
MRLTCNIDSRGRMLRLILGVVFLLAGLTLLILWAWRSGSTAGWIASGILIVSGGFMIFEARKGWCALRAAGLKIRV